MCIGIPMQVRECSEGFAICEGMGLRRQVDTLLVGDQPIGTWVLVFLSSAREVLTEQDAAQISKAVTALDQVMSGESSHAASAHLIDEMFADLVDREPPKPASLLDLERRQASEETDYGGR